MLAKELKMYASQLKASNASKYIDLVFVLRFFLLMGALYYFNVGYISVIDARGMIYSAFFDHHLNYFTWIRSSLLHTANFICHLNGLDSFVADAYRLKLQNGHGIFVDLVCLGYGVMSFWIAFIVAHYASWQRKLIWSVGGVIFLWMLNCCRVALLLIAVNSHWNVNKWMDSHTLFNTVVYAFIFLMIIFYYSLGKQKQDVSIKQR